MNLLTSLYDNLARRARRRGFGVHSPFAYTMTKDILCPAYEYYDEHLIDDLGLDRKGHRLALILFRLAARLGPKRFLCLSPEAEKMIQAVKTASPRIEERTGGSDCSSAIIYADGDEAIRSLTPEMISESLAVLATGDCCPELASMISGMPDGILFNSPTALLYFPYKATRFVAYEILI